MTASSVLLAMLPEHVLLAGIVVLLVVEIAMRRPRRALVISTATVVAAEFCALWLALIEYAAAPFPSHYSIAPQDSLAKAVVLALALPVLMLSRQEFRDSRFHILVLASLYGVCLLLASDSFLTFFLGLELMAMPVYALVVLAFRRPQSAEAALKYLVLGGAATATFLMGTSLLLGWGGSLSLGAFGAALSSSDPLARSAFVLIVVAFFLKAAIVPFHGWAPDAYEAASIPVTAYMATIVKAAVLLAAVRLFGATELPPDVVPLIAVLPLASMVWGNLAAMRQRSFRRMMAYSSIAHAGFLFYAFLGDPASHFEAVLFYVLAYGLMNLLAFAAIPPGTDDARRDRLEVFRGLFHRSPYAAIVIALAMLSLAGIPPLPGFIAKFLVFRNVMAAGYTTYAVLGLVASYLGLYFYLRVIQLMFMSAEEPAPSVRTARLSRAAFGATLMCLLPAIALAVFPGLLIGRL
jgi:NADH-quinone oxidoreductase subunit N